MNTDRKYLLHGRWDGAKGMPPDPFEAFADGWVRGVRGHGNYPCPYPWWSADGLEWRRGYALAAKTFHG